MAGRKETKPYYFSVEGYTELWYLQWLQKQINECPQSEHPVALKAKVEPNPVGRVKGMTIIGKTELWHLSDYEGEDEDNPNRFRMTMDRLKKAESLKRGVKCRFGYSNLTFDLWMVLHRLDCRGELADRKQYLSWINRGFEERFLSMKQYKQEDNFKRCLSKLKLSDVRMAVRQAREIMQTLSDNGYRDCEHRGYRYYTRNPSLEIWRPIEIILKDCGLW